jgi:hypothetical protein
VKIGTDFHAILRICLSNLNGCNVDIIEGSLLIVSLRWPKGHDTHTSFMQIGLDIQAILRFCISNLKHRNVGLTGGRYL